jgi:putative transposase
VRKRTFRYRLYPSAAQERVLLSTLEECRWLYNQLLEERRETYTVSGKGVSMYSQLNRLPKLKSTREALKSVHSQVLQNVALRVELAFKAFFRRCIAGEKPGYPILPQRGAGVCPRTETPV